MIVPKTKYFFLLVVAMAEAFMQHSISTPRRQRRFFTDPPIVGFVAGQRRMVGTVFDESDLLPFPLEPDPLSLMPGPESLSPLEVWCLVKMEGWYSKALSLKCPWMRRRSLDFVDTIEMFARLTLVRKNINIVGPPMGCRGDEKTQIKHKGLALEDVRDVIRLDWKEESHKGYYVTGLLSHIIYRNDCLFDGPDPDLPVTGLRKFVGAASQLFDRSKSTAELLSLDIEGKVIVAKWRMKGVIRLPSRPEMPEVVGKTIYHLDEDNLIYLHEEEWDISAVEAFLKTKWFPSSSSSKKKSHPHPAENYSSY